MNHWRYIVKAQFTARGRIKPSEAIEGISNNFRAVLGEHYDLKHLQEKKRVKLEVNPPKAGTPGRIKLYSNMNAVETAIMAAALEDIRRVDSKEVKIELLGIEDTKSRLREKVKERAQEILSSDVMATPLTSEALKSKVLSGKNGKKNSR